MISGKWPALCGHTVSAQSPDVHTLYVIPFQDRSGAWIIKAPQRAREVNMITTTLWKHGVPQRACQEREYLPSSSYQPRYLQTDFNIFPVRKAELSYS